jgi:hypothetical protein
MPQTKNKSTDQPQIQDKNKSSSPTFSSSSLQPSSSYSTPDLSSSLQNLHENSLNQAKQASESFKFVHPPDQKGTFLNQKSPAPAPYSFSILQICGFPGAKL